MNVNELEGDELDAAVALAEGHATPEQLQPYYGMGGERISPPILRHLPRYSREWTHGGPIIEREHIELYCLSRNGTVMGEWQARCAPPRIHVGPTPLIAAMRAYVASKFGEEIEL